jgi:aldehyde dehydrogenase (NAD+)
MPGPIMSILPFNDIDKVIEKINASKYSLGAGVYTNDLNMAFKLSNALQVGKVYVNCFEIDFVSAPFGGRRQSGVGRDL